MNHLDDWFKEERKKELRKKYGIEVKSFKVVIGGAKELKLRISAKSEKLRYYHG